MEFLAQRPLVDIANGVSSTDPVCYRDNGNRAVEGEEWLAHIEPIAKRLGISRVAEISGLAPLNFPVFQSSRPNLWSHSKLGQNSGSQGKGPTALQAKISCLMEAIEAYCAEPRVPTLVRASYDYLEKHRAPIDPRTMLRRYGSEPATNYEPFMWTPALHLGSGHEVLIPAESVYWYFDAATHDTRALFPMGTSGLASGATYLEAITHGIYELVERMYLGYCERGLATMHCVNERHFEHPNIRGLIDMYDGEYELQMHTAVIPGIQNLPFFAAMLVGDEENDQFVGFGCAASIEVAAMRAVSEALQAHATIMSGAREDIGVASSTTSDAESRLLSMLSEYRDLGIRDYKAMVVDTDFNDLRSEATFLEEWLQSIGLVNTCVSNLTRVGVDVPVVKVVIPGMPTQRSSQGSAAVTPRTATEIAQLRFPEAGKGPRLRRSPARSKSA